MADRRKVPTYITLPTTLGQMRMWIEMLQLEPYYIQLGQTHSGAAVLNFHV